MDTPSTFDPNTPAAPPIDGENAAEPVNLADRREAHGSPAALRLAHSVAARIGANGGMVPGIGHAPMVAVSPMTPAQAVEYQQLAFRAQNELNVRQHFCTLLIDKAGLKDAGEIIVRAALLTEFVLGPKPAEDSANAPAAPTA